MVSVNNREGIADGERVKFRLLGDRMLGLGLGFELGLG